MSRSSSFSRKIRSFAARPIPANPWALFLVLTAAQAAISYGGLGLTTALWVGLFGVVLPVMFVLFDREGGWKRTFEPSGKEGFLPPRWAWVMVGVLAVLMRFFHLGSDAFWPTLHEGTTGYLALELARGHEGGWFFPFNHMPLSYHWGLALLLRHLQPTLTVLWAYPASWTLIAAIFFWRAARLLLPRPLAFYLTVFAAASFPMVYVGRFSLSHSALLAWMGVVSYLGARWFRSGTPSRRTGWAVLLGTAVGAGIHIYYSWAVVMAVAVPLFLLVNPPGKTRRRDRVLFLAMVVLAVAPVAHHMMLRGRWTYILAQVGSPGLMGTTRSLVVLSYLTSLFWGAGTELFAYKPVWGGYLNPIAGSLLLVGVLALLKRRPRWAWGGFAAFLILMVPAWVSSGYEYLRVVQVFPLLILGASYGGWVLVGRHPARALLLSGLVLGSSIGVDFYHLAGPYHAYWTGSEARWATYNASAINCRAYRILREKASRDSAGYIFTEFLTDPADRTLWFASQPFNGLENPRLSGHPCRWAAVLVNANYRPYLSGRFPGSQWTWVSEGLGDTDTGAVLGILPLPGDPKVPLERWRAAQEALREANRAVLFMECDEQDRSADILKGKRDLFTGDPLLESLYWERIFQSCAMNRRPVDALHALEIALKKGYPAAHLLNELGLHRVLLGDVEGARRAFQAALASPENHTCAAENLERLIQSMDKGEWNDPRRREIPPVRGEHHPHDR